MTKFVVGFVFGIIVSSVGFQGIALLADQGVKGAQGVLQEQVKSAREIGSTVAE